MSPADFSIERVTLAITDVDAMVRFYESVFQVSFDRVEAFGTTLYEGTAHGLPLRLCPNEIARVDARRSRHQLELVVAELEPVLTRVREAGGTVRDEGEVAGRRAATVVDPDGNTWVFAEGS